MVGGHSDVGRAVGEQPQHRGQHAADGGHLLALLVDVGGDPEEVPEQLVGPVDEMYLDANTVSARRCPYEHRPGHRRSGTLGRVLVPILREWPRGPNPVPHAWAGHPHGGPDHRAEGVLGAAAGADLIVHAASDTRHFGRADPVQTRHLLDA